jgi:chromosome segregation ATPase
MNPSKFNIDKEILEQLNKLNDLAVLLEDMKEKIEATQEEYEKLSPSFVEVHSKYLDLEEQIHELSEYLENLPKYSTSGIDLLQKRITDLEGKTLSFSSQLFQIEEDVRNFIAKSPSARVENINDRLVNTTKLLLKKEQEINQLTAKIKKETNTLWIAIIFLFFLISVFLIF